MPRLYALSNPRNEICQRKESKITANDEIATVRPGQIVYGENRYTRVALIRGTRLSLMRRWNEHIADTPNGANGIRVSWIKFYFAPETGNP